MALGGMFLKSISPELRAEQQLPAEGLALKLEHVGQYAPHDGAKRAGLKAGDVLISFAGRSDLVRETDLLAYALNQVKPGTQIPIVVRRDGQPLTFTLTTGK